MNANVEYDVDETRPAARAKHYNVYVCSVGDRKNAALLQVATSIGSNTPLEKAATTLQLLKGELDKRDEGINFDWLFPELTTSFLNKDDRRINVLSLRGVNDVTELHALSQIIGSGYRVDVRTAIWIFGRMLKLLVFIHPRGYSIQITPGKVLIHPGVKDEVMHQAILFDWCNVTIHEGTTPVPFCQNDIRTAAKTVLRLLGVREDQDYSHLEESGFIEYVSGLVSSDGDTLNIYDAYYRYVYDVFGKQFHEFTTIQI